MFTMRIWFRRLGEADFRLQAGFFVVFNGVIVLHHVIDISTLIASLAYYRLSCLLCDQ